MIPESVRTDVPDWQRRTKRVIVRVAAFFLNFLARSGPVSRALLVPAGFVARRLPDAKWKNVACGILDAVRWPPLELAAVPVEIAEGVRVRMIPHPGEFDGHALVYRRLEYEPEVFSYLDRLMPEIDAVVEIGANVGVYTLYFAARLLARDPKHRVYAFEPSREAFARLNANLAMNPCPNVLTFNVAIAGEAGFLPFFEPQGHLTNGSLFRDFAATFDVDAKATMVASVGPTEVASLLKGCRRPLLKIDVEGAEGLVLKALEPIWDVASPPDMIVEVLTGIDDELNAIAALRRRYELVHLTSAGPRESAEFRAGKGRDYHLRPKVRDGST